MTKLIDTKAFFYVDGCPTKGAWIDIDSTTEWDDIKGALMVHNLIGAAYGGDVQVADTEGLAGTFYSSSTDSLDLGSLTVCIGECEENDIDPDAAQEFVNWCGSWDYSKFSDAYRGEHNNEVDFVEQEIEERGVLSNLPENLKYYFDYDKYAQDCFINDFVFCNGHVFSTNV